MSQTAITTLKGFRDFLPRQALQRAWLKRRLEDIFQSWGYDPLETPTLEPLELFAGQIGEDEKLFYQFTDNGGRRVALRYDQTVPACRLVGQLAQQLPLPFKRYQIQPAFRAENPQKGRYREFLQADADIFGSSSPTADAEVIALSLDIYRQLGFPQVQVLINDRSLLADLPYPAIAALDKLSKIGPDRVVAEMVAKGIPDPTARGYLDSVSRLSPSPALQTIFAYLQQAGFPDTWYRFEPTLARSFSYSSGPIWEIVIPDFSAGSVLGGERYDNLVSQVSGTSVPGTGFGLGFDRTLEAALQFNLVPDLATSTQILVTVFSPDLFSSSQALSLTLRSQGINTDLYPDPTAKLDRQLKYASKKGIPYAAILGPAEISSNQITLKNLLTSTQATLSLSQLPSALT